MLLQHSGRDTRHAPGVCHHFIHPEVQRTEFLFRTDGYSGRVRCRVGSQQRVPTQDQ